MNFYIDIPKFIKDHRILSETIESLKIQGKKIVFTNGCFDIIHVGHVRCLKDAKKLGDVLVVAVNSDVSVRGYKGPGHPYMTESERIEILSAIEYIDFLTLFESPTVSELLLLLKPHIHAKGTDYTVDTVPEKNVVLSYGGSIAIVGDQKNHSSTAILREITK